MKIMLTILALLLTGSVAQADILWTWTNAATGTEQGTFITDGELVADQAPAGSYTVLDFSVTASLFGLMIGSISGGEYYIGQPDIGFDWDGSTPTVFWRSSGGYTNGFGLWVSDEVAPNEPDYIVFNVNYFSIENYVHDVIFIHELQTPILTPGTTAVSITSFSAVKSLHR